MSNTNSKSSKVVTKPVTNLQVKKLMDELSKRLMVVTDNSLNHLIEKGVISKLDIKRAGCCKPDGGTCCPNAKKAITRKIITK